MITSNPTSHTILQLRDMVDQAKTQLATIHIDAGGVLAAASRINDAAQTAGTLSTNVDSLQGSLGPWTGTSRNAANHQFGISVKRLADSGTLLGNCAGDCMEFGQYLESENGTNANIVEQMESKLADVSALSEDELSSLTSQFSSDLSAIEDSVRAIQQKTLAFREQLEALAAAGPKLPATSFAGTGHAKTRFEEMLARFDKNGVFIDKRGSSRSATAWDLSQALSAALALANVPGDKKYAEAEVKKLIGLLAKYWNPATDSYMSTAAPGQTSESFHDDNAWIGIDLVEASRLTGNPSYLARAETIFKGYEKAGYVHGEQWGSNSSNNYIATVSTAGTAQLALLLAGATEKSNPAQSKAYLAWGTKAYDWVEKNMAVASPGSAARPAPGAPSVFFKDHDPGNGAGSRASQLTVQSYNQGLMIGNSALLYQLTGNPAYQANGTAIANATLSAWGQSTGGVATNTPVFNAIFSKNLQMLNATLPTPNITYTAAVQQYATTTAGATVKGFVNQAGIAQAQAYAQTPLSVIRSQLPGKMTS